LPQLEAARDLTQAFEFRRVGAHFAFPTAFDGALRPFKLVPSVNDPSGAFWYWVAS
jgi:hypothetical protein